MNIFSNVFTGIFDSFKSWLLPLGIILVLLIILFIAKAIQKRNSEKSLETIRKA
jgi:ABC-type transport system involved in cytochrome bd biosynthesis fused ATPase/permease subunit